MSLHTNAQPQTVLFEIKDTPNADAIWTGLPRFRPAVFQFFVCHQYTESDDKSVTQWPLLPSCLHWYYHFNTWRFRNLIHFVDVFIDTVRGFAQSFQANVGMLTSHRSRLPGYSVLSSWWCYHVGLWGNLQPINESMDSDHLFPRTHNASTHVYNYICVWTTWDCSYLQAWLIIREGQLIETVNLIYIYIFIYIYIGPCIIVVVEE